MSGTFKIIVVTVTGAQHTMTIDENMRSEVIEAIESTSESDKVLIFSFNGHLSKGVFVVNMRNVATIHVENE